MMYQMGVYCRLSKDDGENKVSESIENQRIWKSQIFILMTVIRGFILRIDRNFSG